MNKEWCYKRSSDYGDRNERIILGVSIGSKDNIMVPYGVIASSLLISLADLNIE